MSSLESASPDENRGTNVSRSCALPTQQERLPHSRWGILSFRLAIYSLVFFCVLSGIHICQIVVDPETYRNSGTWYQEAPLSFIIVVFGTWACFLSALAAFILGIVGVHQRRVRKIFSVCGILLSLHPFILLPMFIHIISAVGGSCC